METLSYALAPKDWAICFQHDCPMANKCLRHAVALLAPSNLTHHNTVLPAARKGDTCSMFATAEPVKIMRGMRSMLPRIYSEKVTAIRQDLYKMFGSVATFYRYRDGRHVIAPELQARIESVFRKHGIEEPPTYDDITLAYHFPRE